MALARRFCYQQIGAVGRNAQLFSSQKLSPPPGPEAGSFRGEEPSDGGQGPTGNDERVRQEHKEDELKSQILNVALNYVKTNGWNVNSISAAAEELNLAPSISGIFKDYDLIRYFITKNNVELEDHLSQNQVSIRDALEWRLRKVVPYIDGYPEAIAIAAQPQNLTHSVRLLQQMADTVAHHSLKDTSSDITWYTKRVSIAALYMSAEMCLIQDKSEGQLETWKFLDRRAEEFEKLKKGEFAFGSLPMPELFHAGFTTLQNVLGRNASR